MLTPLCLTLVGLVSVLNGATYENPNDFLHVKRSLSAEDIDPNDFEFDRVFRVDNLCDLTGVNDPADHTGPCGFPESFPADWLPTEDFDMKLLLFVNSETNWVRLIIEGNGFPTAIPITTWQVTFPWLPGAPFPPPHPIHFHIIPAAAFASTTAAFTSGRDPFREPNSLEVNANRDAYLDTILDWNPLVPNQAPMSILRQFVNQADIPIGGVVDFEDIPQVVYQQSGRVQPIAREYLRRFHNDGSPKVDSETLKAKLARYPNPISAAIVIAHLDQSTHGVASGNVALPPESIIENPMLGDHYELGIFDFSTIYEVTDQFINPSGSSSSSSSSSSD